MTVKMVNDKHTELPETIKKSDEQKTDNSQKDKHNRKKNIREKTVRRTSYP